MSRPRCNCRARSLDSYSHFEVEVVIDLQEFETSSFRRQFQGMLANRSGTGRKLDSILPSLEVLLAVKADQRRHQQRLAPAERAHRR